MNYGADGRYDLWDRLGYGNSRPDDLDNYDDIPDGTSEDVNPLEGAK